jgi:hypothetical protein
MYGQPWYSGYPTYPTNAGFNPYIHPAYARALPYDVPLGGPTTRSTPSMRALQEERARALAERRVRRARYLPDEDDEMEDYNFWPSQLGPQQSELTAKARQEELERLQREEALRAQEQEELRQRQLEQLRRRQEEEALRRQEEFKRLQEAAARKQVEDERRRQAALEQQQKRREELARKHREEQEARQRMIEEQKNFIRLRREEEARRLAVAEEERVSTVCNSDRATYLSSCVQRSRIAEQQRKAASRSPSPSSASKGDNSIPIHFHRPTSPHPTGKPSSRPATPTPTSPRSAHTLEEKIEAASRIQKQYRIHRTYRKLEDIRTQFEGLKKGFTFPHLIDFEKPGSEGGVLAVGAYRVPSDFDKDDVEPMEVDNIPEGKLAYNSTNYALHFYSDQLDKLLIKLDGIESYGEKDLREQRRAAVKAIEREASKLDRYCKQTWLDYVEKQRQGVTASEPAQQSNPGTTDQPSDTTTEQASSTQPSEIPISSDIHPDESSMETVHVEAHSESLSADDSSEPSASASLEEDTSESADAAGRAEATGDVQPEPEQEGAMDISTDTSAP